MIGSGRLGNRCMWGKPKILACVSEFRPNFDHPRFPAQNMLEQQKTTQKMAWEIFTKFAVRDKRVRAVSSRGIGEAPTMWTLPRHPSDEGSIFLSTESADWDRVEESMGPGPKEGCSPMSLEMICQRETPLRMIRYIMDSHASNRLFWHYFHWF